MYSCCYLLAKRFQSLINIINRYTLIMYSIGLATDFLFIFIGVVKTHLCSRPISYFPYEGGYGYIYMAIDELTS